jgi:replication factor C subunit 1
MYNLWINKYKPKNSNEIVGNKNQIKEINYWIKNIDNDQKMSLIVSGNHGIGKSLSVKYVLQENKYLVKTILPNEIKLYRNDEDFKDFFNYKNSINNKLKIKNNINKNKLAIIFDETESITLQSEKKFILELFKINNKYKKIPIIFISNNQHSKLLNDLKKNCKKIQFVKPANFEIKKLITKICNSENINLEKSIFNEIISYSKHDIRRMINMLQELNYHKYNDKINKNDFEKFKTLSQEKYNTLDLFKTTEKLINNFEEPTVIQQYYEYEKVLIPLMIHENYYKKILNQSSSDYFDLLKVLSNTSESISLGDNIETSIYTDQNWFLQTIHCFFSSINSCYWIDQSKSKPIKLSSNDPSTGKKNSDFSSDLNKTSLKNINRKNINNLLKILPNKSLDEILYINKIANYLAKEKRIPELVDILKKYNKSLNIKDVELCIKIDKTQDFVTFNSTEKKNITKYIN